MPYQLKGRKVLITGASRGLGAEIARKFAAEGCSVAINYVSSSSAAESLAKELQQTYNVQTLTLQADCGVTAEVTTLVQKTIEVFGGLDIIIGNAGWTRFAEFGDLGAMSDAEWDKCWKTNVLGMKQLLQDTLPTFNANPDGGVFIITSSIAGKSLAGSSMAYSVTKAAQLHLMKCMANTQGPKVRVNAILPGLLLTDWGLRYGDEKLAKLKDAAALKKETDLSDCADAYVSLSKNSSVTGQSLIVDSGLLIQNM